MPHLVTTLSVTTLCLTNRDLCRSLGSRWPNWGERRTRWPRETRSDRIAWPYWAPGIYSKARGLGIQVVRRQLQARARERGAPHCSQQPSGCLALR